VQFAGEGAAMSVDVTSASNNRVYRPVGFALLFLIIATVVFVFVKTLVFDQPLNNQALRQALVAASVGVTLSCLIAWVLDLLQVVDLRAGWSKLLWAVLVASILGTSAIAYKAAITQPETNPLSVACVRPVAVDENTGKWIEPIALRTDASYKRGGYFGFLLVLRSLQTDPHGDSSFDVHYEFDDPSGKAAFMQAPYTGNASKLRADPAVLKKIDEYKRAAPDCITETDREVLVRSNLQPADGQVGPHELNIVVYDNVGGTFARATLPTRMSE
jgi:hypothetical protein